MVVVLLLVAAIVTRLSFLFNQKNYLETIPVRPGFMRPNFCSTVMAEVLIGQMSLWSLS